MKLIAKLLIPFMLFACVDGVPDMPEPKHQISHKQMVDVLTELVQLESAAQLKYVQLLRYGKMMEKTGDSLLKAKGYTPEQFNENMDYYGSRQDEMMEIYEEVKANLMKEKVKLEAELKKERDDKATEEKVEKE